MSSEIYQLHRGEKRPFAIDWGENTAGLTSGPLPASDTVASAVVVVDEKPTDAVDPTIGTVTVNATAIYVNDRSCSAGEAISFPVTLGASQAYGEYALMATATTTGGYVLKACVRFICVEC